MIRLVFASFSGLMLYASLQPTGLWWAAPLGMALFFASVTRRTAIWGAWLQACVFYGLALPWVGEFVGWYAWVALAAVQSLYSLAFGLGLRYLLPQDSSSTSALRTIPGQASHPSTSDPSTFRRFLLRSSPTPKRQSPAQSVSTPKKASRAHLSPRRPTPPHPAVEVLRWVLIAAWFVATEYLRSSWPFGGFPWGRLAWGQVSGPLAWWVQLGGPALVTFVVVLCGAACAQLLRLVVRRHPDQRHSSRALAVPACVTLVLLAGVGWGVAWNAERDSAEFQKDNGSTAHIAAVQGNVPRLGLDFNAQRRAVLDNHARRTELLARDVQEGKVEQPDLVFWPENAADVNPYAYPEAAEILDAAVRRIHAPILVGTVTPEHNRMVVWDESGPGEFHDKRFLQPFGEYMPLRELLRKVTPLVDKAGHFQPGTGNAVVTMTPHATGSSHPEPVQVGVSTCYEISFDGSLRSAVRAGARLLTTPTNNATFGFTDMTYQQLAMSRMRAMEYDRALVVAATSGVSAIVLPNGEVMDQTHIFQADTLSATLPLHDSLTISARVGDVPERVLSIIGVVAVLVGMLVTARSRTRVSTARRN